MEEVIDRKEQLAIENSYHKIYWDNDPEFEEVRELCLQDHNNWLRDNYTRENMDLNDQCGYSVVYRKDTHEPMFMSGMMASGLWDPKIARLMNRLYVFPKFQQRTVQGLAWGWENFEYHMINPLIEANKNRYKAYFISMQSRPGKDPNNWWRACKKTFMMAIDNWTDENEHMIKVCGSDVQKCYHHYFYTNAEENYFENSTKNKLITFDEWKNLPTGK